MAAKVLILGSLSSLTSFTTLLPKLTALQSKNNFNLCLILGDLFSPADEGEGKDDDEELHRLVRGEIQIPLPVYFGLGRNGLPGVVREKIEREGGSGSGGGEVCENLFFLGRKTVLGTSEGIRLVVLGGRLDEGLIGSSGGAQEEAGGGGGGGGETDKATAESPFYSPTDAATLKGANHADILLTYEWPSGITRHSNIPIPTPSPSNTTTTTTTTQTPAQTTPIAELAHRLRPRYHFSSGGRIFYEREPYRNSLREKESDSGTTPPVTRFIALADHGNKGGQKWMYAFNIDVKKDGNATGTGTGEIPVGTTECPFDIDEGGGGRRAGGARKRAYEAAGGGGGGAKDSFFWGDPGGVTGGGSDRNSSHRGKRGRGGGGGGGRRGQHEARPPPGPSECFFCLSNPLLSKHLITSIGTDSYLTTAKGPLLSPSSSSSNPSPTLPFPIHILIIPLTHTPTLTSIPDPPSRTATRSEMARYRHAITTMLEKRAACGTVTWEVSRRGGVHTHWQIVPIPASQMVVVGEPEGEGGAEAAFRAEAKADGLGEFEVRGEQVGEEEEEEGKAGEEVDEEGEGEGDFFRVWFTHNKRTTSLVLPLRQDAYFDLQFGRRVVAKLLGLGPRAVNWRECVQTVEEEVRDAKAFKEAFREWDFTL